MNFIRGSLLFIILLLLAACEGFNSVKDSTANSSTTIEFSARAIPNPSRADRLFAQTALNKLGYQVGRVDGIWGPKSARAIRNFENLNNLQSANGHLSELNLNTLESVSSLKRSDELQARLPKPNSLSAQIDQQVPIEDAPQLIILKQAYSVFSKPNPYSEIIASAPIGSGVYVVSLQNGWYGVEIKSNVRGFIKAN